jgi:hydrogenase expression/formation protein HypC
MCLAVPGQVIEIYQENGLPMGRIDYAGVVGAACLAYTPEAVEGSWVIVHTGFALQVLDEAEAAASLATLTELNELIEADSQPDDDTDSDGQGKLP